ncbi:TetR family transcriptional regulator [Pendulispora rubella]|uniref:TetR family transcriptional regulator n=1 Tax=Pendulispora rubella TaxID=2741070 RepID=A0ABZ2KS17_9BACT
MSKASSAPPARPRGRPGKARPALLEAAVREFSEKGYEGATTAGIARRAKSTQPLVHHHFGSKEQLFRAVLDSLFGELRVAVLPDEARLETPSALVRRFTLFTARRPELARIWLIENAKRGRHASYIMEKHIVPLTERLRPLLETAMAAGVFPKVDVPLLFYAVQGLASYPFLVPEQVRRLSGCPASSPEFAEQYTQTVLAILRFPAD